ncbi:MAG: zinc metallopeptidase, partial [Raoultibacter sp.]
MIISPLYIALIVATLVIGFGATAYVNSQLKKYTKVPSSRNITGAETARRMLAANGVTGVTLREGSAGQDHF